MFDICINIRIFVLWPICNRNTFNIGDSILKMLINCGFM